LSQNRHYVQNRFGAPPDNRKLVRLLSALCSVAAIKYLPLCCTTSALQETVHKSLRSVGSRGLSESLNRKKEKFAAANRKFLLVKSVLCWWRNCSMRQNSGMARFIRSGGISETNTAHRSRDRNPNRKEASHSLPGKTKKRTSLPRVRPASLSFPNDFR